MILSSKRSSLNEAYIGKQAVSELQKQLSIVRAKLRDRNYNPSMGQDKEILKFNRLVEKQFGYTDFALTISPDNSLNAYTIPISFFISDEERKKLANALKTSKNGFRFDPKYGAISAVATLNMGCINSEYITDEELMAILLHEIGHNFFEATVSDTSPILTRAIIMTKSLAKLNKMIVDKISLGKYIDVQEIVKDVESGFKNTFKYITGNVIVKPYNFLKDAVQKLFKREAMDNNLNKRMIRYTDEKFADTFAAMYGYGVELHSALQKMTDEVYQYYPQSRNPIVVICKAYSMYISDMFAFMSGVKDEHPDDLARIKVSVEYLKKEISREGIDPKLKSKLINQMDELNRIIDEFLNFPKDKDNMRVTRTYYSLLWKKFGGDRREKVADNDALFDVIDSRYRNVYSDN